MMAGKCIRLSLKILALVLALLVVAVIYSQGIAKRVNRRYSNKVGGVSLKVAIDSAKSVYISKGKGIADRTDDSNVSSKANSKVGGSTISLTSQEDTILEHWVPDWYNNSNSAEDLEAMLIKRRTAALQRCHGLNGHRHIQGKLGIIYSKSLQYCPTLKAGYSFWKNFFRSQNKNDTTLPEKIPSKRVSLVVSRNPWHRLVSCWHDRFTLPLHAQGVMAKFCYGKTWPELPPFSEFIHYCVAKHWKQDKSVSPHWKPTIYGCRLCGKRQRHVDFIKSGAAVSAAIVLDVEPQGESSASSRRPEVIELDNIVSFSNEEEDAIQLPSRTQSTAKSVDIPPRFVPSSTFTFPKRIFGDKKKRQRGCYLGLFDDFPWLSYVLEKDVVVCHPCFVSDLKGLHTFEKRKEKIFIDGFCRWSEGSRAMERHEESTSHLESVNALNRYNTQPIDELMDKNIKRLKEENNTMLAHVIEAVRFLARQNLAVRGATYKLVDDDQHSEPNGNLIQTLMLLTKYSEKLPPLLGRKLNYTSPDVQNELLKIMSQSVVRKLAKDIRDAPCYSIMIDETTDVTNKEQAVFCFRFVQDLKAHEYFVGLYHINDTSAKTLFNTLKDVLLQLNIPLENCRGQCYDGAAAMSGKRSGLKTRIQEENPKAIYVHCYAHTLQLAVQDSVGLCKRMRGAMDLVADIAKLIKCSPKREAQLKQLQIQGSSVGIRTLCPTRWTVRASSFNSVLRNYGDLIELFQLCLESSLDPDVRSRISGVLAQMTKFDSFFGMKLSLLLFEHTDNLSKALQSADLSATDGFAMATAVIKVIELLRTDGEYTKFWNALCEEADNLDIDKPKLSRKRKAPSRFDENSDTTHTFNSPKDMGRVEFFGAVENTCSAIRNRFVEEEVDIFISMKSLIFDSINADHISMDLVKSVCSKFVNDFDSTKLVTQLKLLPGLMSPSSNINTVADFAQWMRSCKTRPLLTEVEKLVIYLLSLPATNAVSERSFSGLRRVKTYLRSTMTQHRLNHVMVLHVHKELMDSLRAQSVITDYVEGHTSRDRQIACL